MEHIHMCVCWCSQIHHLWHSSQHHCPHLPCIHRLSFTSFQPPPLAFDDLSIPSWTCLTRHSILYAPHIFLQTPTPGQKTCQHGSILNTWMQLLLSLIRDPYFSLWHGLTSLNHSDEQFKFSVPIQIESVTQLLQQYLCKRTAMVESHHCLSTLLRTLISASQASQRPLQAFSTWLEVL